MNIDDLEMISAQVTALRAGTTKRRESFIKLRIYCTGCSSLIGTVYATSPCFALERKSVAGWGWAKSTLTPLDDPMHSDRQIQMICDDRTTPTVTCRALLDLANSTTKTVRL